MIIVLIPIDSVIKSNYHSHRNLVLMLLKRLSRFKSPFDATGLFCSAMQALTISSIDAFQ